MRPRVAASLVCGLLSAPVPAWTAGITSSGWNGIPWGSSLETLRKSYATGDAPQTRRPLCYTNEALHLHPVAYLLHGNYVLDGARFLVTFCFYDGRLDGVDMLAATALGSEALTKLPADLAEHYGAPVFSGGYLDQPGKQLTKWDTVHSYISFLDTAEVVDNTPVHSLHLIYVSSDFIAANRRSFQATRAAVP